MLPKNRKIKKQSRYQGVVFSILVGFFLLMMVGFLVVSNLRMNQRRGELMGEIEKLQKEIELFEERNEQLKTGILQTESDDYWEARVREHGYIGQGEEAIVIIPPEEKEEAVVPEEKAFLKGLLDWILRRD